MFRMSSMIALFFVGSMQLGFAQRQEHGFFSEMARPIWNVVAGSPKPLVMQSPDGLSRATAIYIEDVRGNEHIELSISGEIGRLELNIGPGVGSELLWAPDSKAFFVTTSDEGGNGRYRLIVVGAFAGELQHRELTDLISAEFGHPFRCGWPESPNVAGIGWSADSHYLWVAAEVIAHSNCDSDGTFEAYEVNTSKMGIVRKLNQLEAKRELSPMLGKELRAAPDECVRDPKLCYVSTNHPELNQYK